MITGKEKRTSFFVPESDVKVDEPVKFSARYDDIDDTNSTIDRLFNEKICWLSARMINAKDAIAPRMPPFIEKALPGKYGSRPAVKTVPVKTANNSADKGNRDFVNPVLSEKPPAAKA